MSIKTIFRERFVALSLLAIIVGALALRLYRLDYQSLWVDEIASMNGSDPELSWRAVIAYSVGDQPPAFFLLLHGWLKVFAFNDFYGRLPAVIIGIMGILAIFFLGKEVRDNRLGLVASLLTAVNYIHIYFSQEVRFYTLVFLLSTLSYLFFIKAVKAERIWDFFFYALSTTALIYTHYFGLVVLAAQGVLFVLLIIFYSFKPRFIVLSFFSALLVVIGIIPWIPIFFSDAKTESFWIPQEPIHFLIIYFWVYFKDVLTCTVFASLLIAYFFSLIKQFRVNRTVDRVEIILLGGTTLSFLIPLVYSLIQTPMLQVRYTMIALPPLIIMIGLGLRLMKPRVQKILLIATCCTSLFSLVMLEEFYSKDRKEDWRGIVKDVIKSSGPGDVVVSRHSWYCNYYFKSLESSYRATQSQAFVLGKEKPPGVWWLDGFDIRPELDPTEVLLLKNGYTLKYSDSLHRAKVSYYHLAPDSTVQK